MVALYACLAALAGQQAAQVDEPVPGGQREMVLGMVESPITRLGIVYEKDVPMVVGRNNVLLPDRLRAMLGFTRWVVTIGVLGGKNVRILRSESFVEQSASGSNKAGEKVDDTWWVDPDGAIVRHFHKVTGADGVAEADCAYHGDRIDVVRRRPGRADERMTFVHSEGLPFLSDRFKPLVVDGKVVLKKKEFGIFDPLKMRVEHVTLEHRGRFNNPERPENGPLGEYFDLVGKGWTHRIYMTLDGKVWQIDLPRGRRAVPTTPYG